MAGSVLVDAGFLVALLSRRDAHHGWAAAHSPEHPPPWRTCDAVLSEAFHLLGTRGGAALAALLKRRAVVVGFDLGEEVESVLTLMGKYAGVPMSLAAVWCA
jgi:predicted nucleic acid-binding protein